MYVSNTFEVIKDLNAPYLINSKKTKEKEKRNRHNKKEKRRKKKKG